VAADPEEYWGSIGLSDDGGVVKGAMGNGKVICVGGVVSTGASCGRCLGEDLRERLRPNCS